MKKIFITSSISTCERRDLDAKKISEYFIKNGYKIIDKPKNADLIIFVSCAVSKEVAEITFKEIQDLKKYKAELVIAGCLPVVYKDRLDEVFDGKSIGTKDLDKIDEIFPENKIKFYTIKDANTFLPDLNSGILIRTFNIIIQKIFLLNTISKRIKSHIINNLFDEGSPIYLDVTGFGSYFSIRISWGCPGNCSYCVIKKSSGPFHSKPIDECLEELKKGLNKGYNKISITAIDIGAYGIDINSTFPELLDKMTQIPGEYEIAIRSFNPVWAAKYVDDLADILKRKKIKRMDIHIESGSQRVLKLMNRYSNIKTIKETILKLKNACPDLILDTHLMVGFPTETFEEFKETLSFVKDMDLYGGYIHRFSCGINTAAEKIEPKVSDKEIIKRLKFAKKELKKAGYHVLFASWPRLLSNYFVFQKRHIRKK